MKLYRDFFKRAIDIAASGGALLVLAVPLAAVTVWLHFANKGAGAFFLQERPGKNGKIFRVVKFKTMTDERDANGDLLPNAQRLTKVGRIVRATSIDELPQLFNVLMGKMSIIGPRPALWNQDDLVSERDKYHANDIRPGLSGWAQVNGRDELEIPVKAKLDGYYYQKFSLWLDIKILFMTIFKVFKHDGVVEGKHEETKEEKELNEKVGS